MLSKEDKRETGFIPFHGQDSDRLCLSAGLVRAAVESEHAVKTQGVRHMGSHFDQVENRGYYDQKRRCLFDVMLIKVIIADKQDFVFRCPKLNRIWTCEKFDASGSILASSLHKIY